jgi:hypothetical protein
MQQQQGGQFPNYYQKGQKTGELQSGAGTLFDRKVDVITAGLQPRYNKYLKGSLISPENALVICDYILAMNSETNPSNNYRKTTIQILIQLSKFVSKSGQQRKSFNLITRDDILVFI